MFDIYYHATLASNRSSIQRNGFYAGDDGLAGAGIYFSDDIETAIIRARLPKGRKVVVFECSIPWEYVKQVGKTDDNFKVSERNARYIEQLDVIRYDADEVEAIKDEHRMRKQFGY